MLDGFNEVPVEENILDTAYKDLSQVGRARALERVQREYGDDVFTVVTQCLSTDQSLTVREAVMKETGSWPHWPEPKKKRRRRATATADAVTAEPKTEPEPAGEPAVEPEPKKKPGARRATKSKASAESPELELVDGVFDAASTLMSRGYRTSDRILVTVGQKLLSVAFECRVVLNDGE